MEPFGFESFRYGLLPGQQQPGHFAQSELEDRAWRRENGWPSQNAGKALCKLPVGDWIRAHDVVGAVGRVGFEHPDKCCNDVVPVNPGHELFAIAKPSTETQPEGEKHTLQEAATWSNNYPRPRQADPNTVSLKAQGFLFPVTTHVMGEFVMGRGLLSHAFTALVAVETYRRARHQHARKRVPTPYYVHQEVGQADTAVPQCLFASIGPAFIGDAFASQVDDRTEPGVTLQQFEIAQHLHTSTLRLNVGCGLSAEDGGCVALADQLLAQWLADEASATGDQDPIIHCCSLPGRLLIGVGDGYAGCLRLSSS